METSKYIWQNGNFVLWDDAKTHVLTHSLHYGAAAFEGIRSYLTPKGPAIFRLKEHLKRLFYSVSVINMQLPYTLDELTEVTKELVARNELEECYIRPLAYYGYGKMGVNPIGAPVEMTIACWPWGTYIAHPIVDMKTNKYIRIPNSAAVADAKLTGNYLNSILGILQMQGSPYHETLFLDENDHIAEGPAENLFFIKDKTLYTPKLGAILAGITRDTVINIAQHIGLKVIEAEMYLKDAYAADEAFLTGTAIEIMPVRSIDDRIIGNGEMGGITAQLQQMYLDVVHGKNKDFLHYLTYL